MQYVYQEPLNYSKGVGIVFGSFAPLHTGHLDIIYRAKKECLGGVLVVVCGYEGDKGYPLMPLETRYQLTRQFFMDDPLVAVYAISDDELGIAGRTDQWEVWLKALQERVLRTNACGKEVSLENVTFYVGEDEYAKDCECSGLHFVLADRSVNEARATIIRQDPYLYWDSIAQPYRKLFSHNILITGTASEGKTTLTEDLGRYFNLPYSHEWAKDYVSKHSMGDWEFGCTDFLTFLTGQFNHNRSCLENPLNRGIFLSDTDVLVTKMYAKYYASTSCMGITMDEYRQVIEPAADAFAKQERWDKIFVLAPKGEFVNDHVRYMEHSSMEARLELVQILHEELVRAGHADKVEVLTGGYLDNFNRVKDYISPKPHN